MLNNLMGSCALSFDLKLGCHGSQIKYCNWVTTNFIAVLLEHYSSQISGSIGKIYFTPVVYYRHIALGLKILNTIVATPRIISHRRECESNTCKKK